MSKYTPQAGDTTADEYEGIIADLKSKLKDLTILKRAFGQHTIEIHNLGENLNKRNVQIKRLEVEIEKRALSWTTISDLFFNSEQIAQTDTSNPDKITQAVKEWCEMYPEISDNIDRTALRDDFLSRL